MQFRKNKNTNKDEDTPGARRNLSHDIPEWRADCRVNLEEDAVPTPRDKPAFCTRKKKQLP